MLSLFILFCILHMQKVRVLSTLCNLHLDLIVLLTLYKFYICVMIQHHLERPRELGLNCRTTYLLFFWSYHTTYKKEVKCSVQDHKTDDDSNSAWYIWHVPIIETRQSYPYCCFPLFLKKQPRCKLYGPLNHPVRPKTVQTNRKDTPGMIHC